MLESDEETDPEELDELSEEDELRSPPEEEPPLFIDVPSTLVWFSVSGYISVSS